MMNIKAHSSIKKSIAMATVLLSVGVTSANADLVVARMPVRVNVAATVLIEPPAGAIGSGTSKTVSAGVWDTQNFVIEGTGDGGKASVQGWSQDRTAGLAAARYNNGIISLTLPLRQYRNATVSLYSIDGKRIFSGNTTALNGAVNVIRNNVASDVYLLSVKGASGNIFSHRVSHGGGRLSINAKFGDGDFPLRKEASSLSESWTLTASAEGYTAVTQTFTPVAGLNQAREITLSLGNSGVGSFTDPRDGKVYPTVTIGALTWFAKNLNFEMDSSWCYGNQSSNCERYGRLYTWDAAMNACPPGWFVPSRGDWDNLVSAVGSRPGTKLKSETGWSIPSGAASPVIPGTNDFGFSALPGGNRYSGSFYYAGGGGFWWSATEGGSTYAYFRFMYWLLENVFELSLDKSNGLSVRCSRD